MLIEERSPIYIVDGYNLMAAMETGPRARRAKKRSVPRSDRTAKAERTGEAGKSLGADGLSLEDRRSRLLERLTDFAARSEIEVCVVFDGRKGMGPEVSLPHLRVMFSQKPHGADQVIERLAQDLASSRAVHVVTGDYLQQRLVFRANVYRKPPREMLEEMNDMSGPGGRRARPESPSGGYRLGDRLSGEVREELERRRRED